MIFGFGGKRNDDDDDDEDDEDERELCSFQGALNDNPVDMKANARLVQAGLIPAKEIITDAIERRAETVRVEIKGERGSSTFYIDGVGFAGGKMPRPQTVAITQMLKLLCGLDPKLKTAQAGGVKADFQGTPYEVTIDTAPQADGTEKLTARLRNLKIKIGTMEEAGFSAATKAQIRELTSKRHGLILIAGGPGSGVTTTAYAFLRGIDLFQYAAFTIVDMGSREVYNVQKFEPKPEDDLVQTYERIIRAEADVIFSEPIKTADIAKAGAGAADRVCVMGEIPAKDAASSIVQINQWVGDPQKVSEVFAAAYSTKLIRLLCPACKEAFRPNPKLLAKVGLPPETKVLYRKPEPEPDEKTGELPDPCEKCNDVGYIGRTPMLELISASEGMKKLIAEGAPVDQIKAQARTEGMLTFHKDGLRIVAEGKTSLEELQRLFKSA